MLRWTAEMVDATPQYCMKCETKVANIHVFRWFSLKVYVIRCPECGHPLAKLPLPTQTEPTMRDEHAWGADETGDDDIGEVV